MRKMKMGGLAAALALSRAPPPSRRPTCRPHRAADLRDTRSGSTTGTASMPAAPSATASRSSIRARPELAQRLGLGQTGGGLVGYNFQTGHFVYGAEGSIDLNVIRKTDGGRAGLAASRARFALRHPLPRPARLRVRLVHALRRRRRRDQRDLSVARVGPVQRLRPGQAAASAGRSARGVDVKFNPAQVPALQQFLPNGFLGPLILRLEYMHDEPADLDLRLSAARPSGPSRTATSSAPRSSPASATIRPAPMRTRGQRELGRRLRRHLRRLRRASRRAPAIAGNRRQEPLRCDRRHRRPLCRHATSCSTTADARLRRLAPPSRDITGHGLRAGAGAGTSYPQLHPGGYPRPRRLRLRQLPALRGGRRRFRPQRADRHGDGFGARPRQQRAFTVGGGLDYRVSERVSLRGEYLYEFDLQQQDTST